MIKFFRHIRQTIIMENNKTSRYLKYAIGEIILVIIGILIALQINNWNEKRKNIQKMDALLKDVLVELETNIKECDKNLINFHHKDTVYYAIKYKEVTASTYLSVKYPEFRLMMNRYYNVNLTDQAFRVLMANAEDAPIKYKTIIEDLSSLNNILKSKVDLENEWFRNEISNYIKYESENFTWFDNFSGKGNKPMLDYYLNNIDYKNRVAHLYFVPVNNTMLAALDYRKNAIKLHVNINALIEKPIPLKNMVWAIQNSEKYVGEYLLKSFIKDSFIWAAKEPAKKVSFFEHKQRLFYRTSLDTTSVEAITFSKNQIATEQLDFFTLSTVDGDTLLENNYGTVYKKVSNKND